MKHLYTQNGFDLMYDEDGSDFLQLDVTTQSFFREKGVSAKLSHAGFIMAANVLCFAEAYDPSIIQKSVDKELVERAKSLNIPIKPLDTIALRQRMFREFSTFAVVEAKVQNFSRCPNHVSQYRNQYKSGNVPSSQFDEIYAQIALRDRNREWLDKFMSAQKNHDSIFIHAGLNHFKGPYNLLEMLRGEGFVVNVSSCDL